jgi:hypothetical protein
MAGIGAYMPIDNAQNPPLNIEEYVNAVSTPGPNGEKLSAPPVKIERMYRQKTALVDSAGALTYDPGEPPEYWIIEVTCTTVGTAGTLGIEYPSGERLNVFMAENSNAHRRIVLPGAWPSSKIIISWSAVDAVSVTVFAVSGFGPHELGVFA